MTLADFRIVISKNNLQNYDLILFMKFDKRSKKQKINKKSAGDNRQVDIYIYICIHNIYIYVYIYVYLYIYIYT